MRKGQIHLDYIVGFLIFLVVIFLVAFLSFEPLLKDTKNTQEFKNQETAQRISELLIKTKGYPENWENISVVPDRLGLASEPWVLNKSKIDDFYDMNYTEVKNSLDLERIFISVTSSELNFTRGDIPNPKENVAVINRYALLENKTATITVGVW